MDIHNNNIKVFNNHNGMELIDIWYKTCECGSFSIK